MAVKEKHQAKGKAMRGKHFGRHADVVRHRSGHRNKGAGPNMGHAPEADYRVVDVSSRRHMGIEYVPAGPDDTVDLPALRRQKLLRQLSELDLKPHDGK